VNPVCPYCRSEIGDAEEERKDCPGCGTAHHADCFAENGGCTIFGCSQAPVDEPKIQLSGSEVAASRVEPPRAVTPAAVQSSSLPPPPPPVPVADTTNEPPPPGLPGLPSREQYFMPRSAAEEYAGVEKQKSRVAFVLLGVFLGIFGVHNFYAGYMKKGVFQLCLTLFTCFYGAAISWTWALIEICTVSKDFDDVQFT
jgi:TM2 domain-containing membrane protein YozV